MNNRMEEETITEEIESTITPVSVKSLKSPAWSHFTKFVEDNIVKAKCNYCGNKYMADSRIGTTNMNRHVQSCKKRARTNDDIERGSCGKQIDQNVYREKLARAVLLHGYAFLWAEHEGDRDIHLYLNENVRVISRNTMKSECLKLYHNNMERVKSFLESIPGRICLTTDLWTSCNTEGYLCLTAHCIDSDWKLSSRILNFRHVPPPHSAIVLCDVIHGMLKEWGIEKKIFSITMDNALNMDNMQENLCYRLNNSLVCGGQFFHIRCCAHILNLVVQAGLKFITTAVEKVRESVKYVKGSEARKIKFRECVQLAEITSSKGLWLDVTTRWNSTYQMLDRAILYRQAFERLSTMDNHYVHLPSAIEWDKMIEIHKVLKPFQIITNLFSGSDYPTANLYFENVWKIQMRLSDMAKSSDPEIKQMADGMRVKFNKYWGDYSQILSFGVILDPRHKLKLVRSRYKQMNDERQTDVVKIRLENMFTEYSARLTTSINEDRREDTSLRQRHSDDDSYDVSFT
jgi:Domain of unknown function (DUF4413)/BED zinc finger